MTRKKAGRAPGWSWRRGRVTALLGLLAAVLLLFPGLVPNTPGPGGESAGDLPPLARPGRPRPAGPGAPAPLAPGDGRAAAARGRLVRAVRGPAVHRGPGAGHHVHRGPAQRQRCEPRTGRHRTGVGRHRRRPHRAGGADGPGPARLRGGPCRGLPPPRHAGHGRPLVEVPAHRRTPGGHQAEGRRGGLGPRAARGRPYTAGRGRRVRRPPALGADRPRDRADRRGGTRAPRSWARPSPPSPWTG